MHDIWLDCDKLPLIRDIGEYGAQEPAWAHPDRLMDYHLFLFVTEGQLTLWEDECEYILQKGHGLFLKKGVRQWGQPINEPGSRWFFIHFFEHSPSLLHKPEMMPLSFLNKGVSWFSPDVYQTSFKLPKKIEVSNAAHTERKLKEMLQLYQSGNDLRHLLLSMHTLAFFLELYQQSEARKINSKADITVHKIIEILEKNSERKISGPFIASIMKMNYNYLCEVFKKKTGLSILDYHLRLRIDKSAEVLKSGKLTIFEVGERFGFSSPFYFSRIFKKVTGYSPSDYLKNHYIN
ncbi:helix-turn-helix domain-containing protein [Paenibacillus luteus]|uniref:helix-turn-helix domain-containing protein n=1 Tax=Paenibacillus luteus TaxID=2545753 RepID=UPI001143D595|nr:AraC family transcriptional regulator [Paenibacillus luteus]